MSDNIWRKCGSCKKPILLKSKYYACAISTCKKTSYCSMPCFDAHTPIFRHKDAWAEEHISPSQLDPLEEERPRHYAAAPHTSNPEVANDILVVASKLKDYIKTKGGMNTSASVLARLSDMIRIQCDKAIERAQKDGRKTIMDRDFFF